MPDHDTYVLHIWRSRSLAGWQWAARLERPSHGERLRFADPEALLVYLQGLFTSDHAAGSELGAASQPDSVVE